MNVLTPGARAILEAAGIDSSLEEAPRSFAEPVNPIAKDHAFSSFAPDDLISPAGESPSARTPTERYRHVRQFYMRDGRADGRDRLVAQRLSEILTTVKTGDQAAVLELFRRRHVWRQRATEMCAGHDKVCAVEHCTRAALPCSTFCVGHVVRDPDQRLFVECPACNRPHPVMSACFACRDE